MVSYFICWPTIETSIDCLDLNKMVQSTRKTKSTSWVTPVVVIIVLILVVTLVYILSQRTARLYSCPCRSVDRCTDELVHVNDLYKYAQNGDIVVQSSVAWWGGWSKYVLGSDFTHVGVLWFDDDKTPYMADVILSTETKKKDSHVKIEPLANLIEKGFPVVIRTYNSQHGSRDRAILDAIIHDYHSERRVKISTNFFRFGYLFFSDIFPHWWNVFKGSQLETYVKRFDHSSETICVDFVCDVLTAYGARPEFLSDAQDTYYLLPHMFVCNDDLGTMRFEKTLRIVT